MLDIDSPKPLYEQIKEYILHNIHTGDYSPNSRIPSERDLAEYFGVSRVTVNKAVKELIYEGRLYVRIGKGTFIRDEPIDQELEVLTSFTEEMAKRGQSASSKVLCAESIIAVGDTAKALQVPHETPIYRLRRVRFAGQRPMSIEESSIVASLCPHLLDQHDFAVESLYTVLRDEYHVQMTHAQQTFSARAADEDEAAHLALSAGDPVLAISRVTFTHENRPFEKVESIYRGDRYQFRAVLRRI